MRKMITALALAMTTAGAAQAAPFVDGSNDFLMTYTGPLGRDLDVRTTEVFYNTGGNFFDFRATFGDRIGTTAGGFYVFGVNRGAGTARFVTGTPSVGTGVLFDSVVVINQNGTGFARDLIAGVTTNLASSAISFDGASLRAIVGGGLLPGRGFAARDFTVNLWPRVAGGNASIADFAPDGGNFGVTAVPEPMSWAMMIAGFGIVGQAARVRRRLPAVA